MSTSRIVTEDEVDRRTVLGVEVRVVCAVWSDGGRSYSVYRVDDGTDLTVDSCFDDLPTGGQIAALMDAGAGVPVRMPAGHPPVTAGPGTLVSLTTADDVVIVILPDSDRGHPRRVILAGDGRFAVEYRTADGTWHTSEMELTRVGLTHG